MRKIKKQTHILCTPTFLVCILCAGSFAGAITILFELGKVGAVMVGVPLGIIAGLVAIYVERKINKLRIDK